jgi:hypothetical protein
VWGLDTGGQSAGLVRDHLDDARCNPADLDDARCNPADLDQAKRPHELAVAILPILAGQGAHDRGWTPSLGRRLGCDAVAIGLVAAGGR